MLLAKCIYQGVEADKFYKNNENSGPCKIYKNQMIPLQIASLIAWYGASRLMVYQYRKRQSEEWYSQKMFWYLNIIVQLYLLVFSSIRHYYQPSQFAFCII